MPNERKRKREKKQTETFYHSTEIIGFNTQMRMDLFTLFCHKIIDFAGIFGHTYRIPNDARHRLLLKIISWHVLRFWIKDCISKCIKEIKFFEAPPKLNQSTQSAERIPNSIENSSAIETIHRIHFLLFSFLIHI